MTEDQENLLRAIADIKEDVLQDIARAEGQDLRESLPYMTKDEWQKIFDYGIAMFRFGQTHHIDILN